MATHAYMDYWRGDSDFRAVVAETIESEGVFSDHSWDPGGKTKYGITQKLAEFYRLNVETLTVDQAKYIYYEEFWKKTGVQWLAVFDISLAREVFDTCVNTGPRAGINMLRTCLREIFSETSLGTRPSYLSEADVHACRKICKKYSRHLLLALNGYQFSHYIGLLRAGREVAKHSIRGWMTRLEPIRMQKPHDGSAEEAGRLDGSNGPETASNV